MTSKQTKFSTQQIEASLGLTAALKREVDEKERSILMNGKCRRTLSLASMLVVAAAALLLAFLPQSAAADQNDPPGRVARLKYVQGAVSFQPAGEPDWVSAVANRPMTTGDKLWADTGARAELRIGSGTIRLDSSTGFSFLNLDDRTVQLQLTQGTLDIRVQRLGRDEIFEVDTPNQAFSILQPGQYRIQASEDGNSTFVTVRSGEGEATGGGQTYSVHSGERGTFTGTDSINADIVRMGGTDEFDNWGETRDRHDDGSRSTRYVSRDVVGYEDLDDNGSWRNDPTYGNVWTPRVSREWAPYHDGHWAWISPWGWTWVDDAPWGYAPFHYGRWISSRGEWCWVPGPIAIEPVYAPALVAFIGGSNFGLSIAVGGGGNGGNVGWFPLGPREVYVPGYNTSRGYVDRVNVSNTNVSTTTITNVYNNQVTNINNTTINNTNINNTNITYVNKTAPGGVTAVSRANFVGAQTVAKSAVAVNAQQIAAAPVSSRVVVAPIKSSVLGSSASSANQVAQPPAATVNRTVVAKATPPPPPIPFVKQQQALAVHPGQPLAPHEVQTLRTTTVVSSQPLVKQAPPGKAATPSRNGPVIQPVAARPAETGNVPANKPANMPPPNVGANTSVNPNQPTRTDRPPSLQQNNPASSGNGPAAVVPVTKGNAQPTNVPANKPVSMPLPNVSANPSASPNQPARTDRPPPVQQNNPASSANGPAAAIPVTRGNAQPVNSPANKPANMPPPNVGANTAANPNQPTRTDRPPSVLQNNPTPAANPPVNAKLKDPRIDAYRGRPNQPQAPAQGTVASPVMQARPAAPQVDRPPVAPVQARSTPQITAPVERNTRPTAEVTRPTPAPNNPAPQPRVQPAQAPPRQVEPPATSAFKVNKSPIDTNAASQRGQASRAQPIQPQVIQPQVKPLPRAASQPQSKPAHPSPEKPQ